MRGFGGRLDVGVVINGSAVQEGVKGGRLVAHMDTYKSGSVRVCLCVCVYVRVSVRVSVCVCVSV